MKNAVAVNLVIVATLLIFSVQGSAQKNDSLDAPRYNVQGELQRPENYREWVWLSSGLGMTYGPLGKVLGSVNPKFDNVFASPSSYRQFMQTGKWPDKTMLVLEVRASETKGSINQGGHFQGGVVGVEVHVKDENRFPDKWAFFGFGVSATTAKAIPTTQSCYSCHSQHGVVDTTFVQFYPTLLEVAKQKGTAKATE